MNSSFPNRWPFSYLKFTKYVTNIITEPSTNTDSKNKQQQGTTTEAPPRNGKYKNTGEGELKPVLRVPNLALSFYHGSKHTVVRSAWRFSNSSMDHHGETNKVSVPTYDLIPKTRRCRNQHSMAFQTLIANTDVYKGSFFPQTIRDWNALPDSLISSAEDAEDCVAKFTSLVRARD